MVIGIHTPETEGEKNVKTLRKKLKDAGLDFPVAVDNSTTMWKRYHNNYWPSIYLIDRNGIALGWAGELALQAPGAKPYFAAKIDEMLKK